MLPIIVKNSKEIFQYLYFNIQLYWMVHHTPSRYMDIYGWLKSTTQFYTVHGTYTINNKVILLYGYDNHLYDHALSYIYKHYIQLFVLKSGNSGKIITIKMGQMQN